MREREGSDNSFRLVRPELARVQKGETKGRSKWNTHALNGQNRRHDVQREIHERGEMLASSRCDLRVLITRWVHECLNKGKHVCGRKSSPPSGNQRIPKDDPSRCRGREAKNVSVSQNSKHQYLQGESEGKRGLLTHLLESVDWYSMTICAQHEASDALGVQKEPNPHWCVVGRPGNLRNGRP
jgi:hypothetical protein